MPSDYFAQGMSFKGEPWILHLALPDEVEKFSRANLIVPLTRPSLWSELRLLTPLWPEGDEDAKKKFCERFKSALKPDKRYSAEMERARALASSPYMKSLYDSLMVMHA